jgi:hypothetical protein
MIYATRGGSILFSKRVKLIRDINKEIDILNRKCTREISKFNDNLGHEIKKRFKKVHPGLHVDINQVYVEDFLSQKNSKNAFIVTIISLNEKCVHQNGVWVSFDDNDDLIETQNIIECSEFLRICDQLSEELGICLYVKKIHRSYQKY